MGTVVVFGISAYINSIKLEAICGISSSRTLGPDMILRYGGHVSNACDIVPPPSTFGSLITYRGVAREAR